MLKRIFIYTSFILSILSCLSIIRIDNSPRFNVLIKEQPIGTLIINKINLKEDLYDINSEENNVDRHVTILKESIFPDNDNSIMFIAAHSGEGSIAYFNDLDKLEVNDSITLILNKKEYTYLVKDVWEDKKDGYININKDKEKQLILTTCSPTRSNYQLIVNCIQKES